MVMNSIQTAGQQKYYDFISERIKSIRTGMIVWMSLLCLALISIFNNIVLAVIFAAIGGVLAVKNVKDQRNLKAKLDMISDKDEFFRQLLDTELMKVSNGYVLVMKDYILVYSTDVFVYSVDDMKEIIVNRNKKDQKSLSYIDEAGKYHEILSCKNNERDLKDFERIYLALSQRVGV